MNQQKRILAHGLARELSVAELSKVAGARETKTYIDGIHRDTYTGDSGPPPGGPGYPQEP